MRMFRDTERETIISEDEIRNDWNGMTEEERAEYDDSFEKYLNNCLVCRGGTLEELTRIHEMFETIEKTANVSDPESWYGFNDVEVSVFVCHQFHRMVEVRIYVDSGDDFAMVLDNVVKFNEGDTIDVRYNKTKVVFDKMVEYFYNLPKVISVKSLEEMGFTRW